MMCMCLFVFCLFLRSCFLACVSRQRHQFKQPYIHTYIHTYIHAGHLLKIAIVGSHVLKRGVERRLPMICANPDERAMLPDGTLGHMPGAIAAEYTRLGGQVVMFGKPDRKHFDASKALVTSSIAADAASTSHAAPPVRFLHVGDSLHHDIAGASNAEVDSLFIGGGIHASALGLGEGGEGELEEARVHELQGQVGINATYALRLFVW